MGLSLNTRHQSVHSVLRPLPPLLNSVILCQADGETENQAAARPTRTVANASTQIRWRLKRTNAATIASNAATIPPRDSLAARPSASSPSAPPSAHRAEARRVVASSATA